MNNWKKERSMSLGVLNTERSFKLCVRTLFQFCVKKNEILILSAAAVMLLRISLSCINFRNLFDMWVIADYFCIFVFLSGAGINRIRKPLSQSWNFSTSEKGWGAGLLRGELHWVLHAISTFSFETIVKAAVNYPSSLNFRLFYSHNRSGT